MDKHYLAAAAFFLGYLARENRFEGWAIFARLALVLCLCKLWVTVVAEAYGF